MLGDYQRDRHVPVPAHGAGRRAHAGGAVALADRTRASAVRTRRGRSSRSRCSSRGRSPRRCSRYAGPMGLPLDDSYIYLTYAKQFGRAQPFTYFPGGGYSRRLDERAVADAARAVLDARRARPRARLGLVRHVRARSTPPSRSACIGSCARSRASSRRRARGRVHAARDRAVRVVRAVGHGGRVRERAARRRCCCCCCGSRPSGPPRKLLVACLAAASLSRPEAMLLVFAIVGVACVARLRAARLAPRRGGSSPLGAAGRVAAREQAVRRQLLPEHRRREEPLLPAGLRLDVLVSSGRDARPAGSRSGLFWDDDEPARVAARDRAAVVVGAVRVGVWARREKQWLVGALVIVAPFAMMLAVIAIVGAVELPELSLHRAGVPAARDPRRLRAVAADRAHVRLRARGSSRRRGPRLAAVRARRAAAAARRHAAVRAGRDGHEHAGRRDRQLHPSQAARRARDVPRRRRDRLLRRRRGLRHARPRHEPPGRHREQRPRLALRVPREPAARAAADALRVLPGLDGHARVLRRRAAAHAAAPRRSSRGGSSATTTCRSSPRTGITSAPASGRSTITPAGRSSIASTSPTSRASARTAGSARMGRRKLRRSDGALVVRRARDARRPRPRRRPHDPRRRRALHDPPRSEEADAPHPAHRRRARAACQEPIDEARHR